MSASPPVIRLNGLSKSFDGKAVLDGLGLSVARGESLVIVGKSGTGKSVLLKHVIGLLRPDAGTVEIEGEDFWKADRVRRNGIRRKFGMAFQEGALFDSMSVEENIAFPLVRNTKMSPAEVRARVAECLDLVHLSGLGSKSPAELSGGMRRRLGFARAIALSPSILLFDEPTTGLDPITTDVIVGVITALGKRMGPTSITITHDLKFAFAIADRVALLHGGRILVSLPPKEFEASSDPHVAAFVRGDASLEEPEDTGSFRALAAGPAGPTIGTTP
ncbi:MAG: ABC transporter ATP-binding protein [Acidithiobacillales bacterium]